MLTCDFSIVYKGIGDYKRKESVTVFGESADDAWHKIMNVVDNLDQVRDCTMLKKIVLKSIVNDK